MNALNNGANSEYNEDVSQSYGNNVCRDSTTYEEPRGAYMKKREVKKSPPASLEDLKQVVLEEGESKYVAIYIRGQDNEKSSFKPLLVRGCKGCDFYGAVLDRFVRDELSHIDGAKGKYSAEIIRAGRYKHVGLVKNEHWTIDQDMSGRIFSRNVITWEDETVYGSARHENEYEKTMEILGDYFGGDGYCLDFRKNEDRRTIEKEAEQDPDWKVKHA